jgi:hypothetical protein
MRLCNVFCFFRVCIFRKRSRSLHRRDTSNIRKSCSRTRSRTHSIRASRSRSHYRSRHETRRRSHGRSYHRTRSGRYSSRHTSESPRSRRARLEERRLEVLRETEEERQKQEEARRAKEEEDKKR